MFMKYWDWEYKQTFKLKGDWCKKKSPLHKMIIYPKKLTVSKIFAGLKC